MVILIKSFLIDLNCKTNIQLEKSQKHINLKENLVLLHTCLDHQIPKEQRNEVKSEALILDHASKLELFKNHLK